MINDKYELFQNLKKEALQTRLTHDEKQRIRVALYEAMRPAPRPQAPRAEMEVVRVVRPVRSTFVWFSPRFALPVAVLLVCALGTGTAFASQGALPGDALYAIKVNVTEPAVGALAIGDEAKAQWHVQVAQTRLKEAEALAASGKLDATTSAQITQNFDANSSDAQTLVQQIENKDPGTGVEIAAQFDSSLQAHSVILSRLGNSTKGGNDFAEKVASHARQQGSATLALATNGPDMNSEDRDGGSVAGPNEVPQTFSATSVASVSTSTVSSSSASTTASSSESIVPQPQAKLRAQAETQPQRKGESRDTGKLKKSVTSALADAQDAFANAKDSLDASTTDRLTREFARMQSVIDQASSTAALTGVLKDATVLEAFLTASKQLNRNLFIHADTNQSSVASSSSPQGGSSTPTKSGGGSKVRMRGKVLRQTNAVIAPATTQAISTASSSVENNDQSLNGSGTSGTDALTNGQNGTNTKGRGSNARNGFNRKGDQGNTQDGEDSFVNRLLNDN